jgi:glycosyltransferase involved in cell wall biosynthesis
VDAPKSTDSKLRILVVSPWKSRWSAGPGAGVSDDHHFISELTQRGVELHFLVPRSDEEDLKFDNLFFHAYPNFFDATSRWPTALKRLLWPAMFYTVVSAYALRIARKVRPDFVLGHSHYGSVPAYMCRELLRIPSGLKLFGVMDMVHTEWSTWRYTFKNIEQIAALKVPQDVWLILDDGTRGNEAALRHGVPPDRIRFLPNGVDIDWLNQTHDRDEARRSLEVPMDAKVVLFLARLVESKRPELVIESIPEIKRLYGDSVLFLFVGDGPLRSACESLVARENLGDSVRFVGSIPHARVPEVMAASDVFVSTSRLTNVAIPTCEAFVCGLPVVVMDVGSTAEVVRHGETGLVVPDGDVPALAKAIAGILKDDERRHSIAMASRAYAAENFVGWQDRIAMELDLIQSTIKKARE